MGWGFAGDLVNGAKKAAGGAADFVGDKAKEAGNKFDSALDIAGDVAKDVGGAAKDAGKTVSKTVSDASISDIGHTALDVAGMVPVIGEAADLANAGWYLAEGDKTNAALSAAGAIPFAGNAATAAKWGKKAVDAADLVGDAAKVADKAGDVVKAGSTAKAVDNADVVGSIRNVNPRKAGEPGPGSGVPNRYENCVNCSVATDSMLSGSPASALPGLPTNTRTLERMFDAKFKPVGSTSDITSSLSEAGHGARGIVHGMRDGGRIGHVFNAVNQKGVVRFLDGQTGRPASFDGFEQFRFMRTN